jgi:hypothetical protein
MNSVAVTVCASAWVTLKQVDSVARALTVSQSAQRRFKIAAIVGFRLAEIAILTATVLWATGSKLTAQDDERCQLAASPDIFSDDDPVDEEFEYGEDPIDEELPTFPGDVEMTAEVGVDDDEFEALIDRAIDKAIDRALWTAQVSAYWQCGRGTSRLTGDEVALVEAALAAA